MWAALQRLPFPLILQGIGAVSMFIPAIHAYQLRYLFTARAFLYSGLIFSVLFVMLAIALSSRDRPARVRGQLLGLTGALVLLPLMLAVPFREALRDTSLTHAWFEMISCLTTTGGSVYGIRLLPPTLDLWRAMVAWMGGLLFWVSALAILAPLNLGGFEVISTDVTAAGRQALRERRSGEAGERLWRYTQSLAPIYVGLTLVLWFILSFAGHAGTTGAILAMSTMSTSGIVPGTLDDLGLASEMVIFVFLFFAVSRLTFRRDYVTRERGDILRDPEIRLALVLLVTVPGLLFLRHFVASIEAEETATVAEALRALWGAVFTTLSFLTTTGFVSASLEEARTWSNLDSAGLILVGLSLFGGGVATTAGGVKLLRIYALYTHGVREMELLVHPNSVGAAGSSGRRLRRQGAFVAWIFFMLFAITIAACTAALSLAGVDFESAIVLSIAALSNTGPLATDAAAQPIPYSGLTPLARAILAMTMVLGRLELLAIIALFTRNVWRS
ncbi:potassium transporter TrkG [Palleronia caenipelagi]|uniref:TrkH family potassium uptake protein n=1 Tax=Palleronia caenipelagi TaxID=2489174 RepID=A0A547QAN0_9RHOB|nr:potassium transporter TrkG [Palleronia caenipelagi]TRD23441.1 TrkH family potassium uptake protein [Palleronia caenipelagi]